MLVKVANAAIVTVAQTLLAARWPEQDHQIAAQFVIDQVGRMQGALRLAIRILAVTFACTAPLRCGRRLARLDQAGCLKLVGAWRNAPVGPMREFVRMVETLALFAAYGGKGG